MSARSFRSVGWVAGVAATALGCYMVNLKVASERAALEEAETRIVLAERDIRLLQTEIGTRGRLAQLEKWNVKVLALSAPAANQFMDGSFQLATLVAPQKVLDPAAPVVLASAPAPVHRPVLASDGAVAPAIPARPAELLHTASLTRPTLSSTVPVSAPRRKEAVAKPKPAPASGPKLAAAPKAKAKAATDPLAPMPEVKTAAVSAPRTKTTTQPKAKPATTTKPKSKEAQAKQ